jgi:alkanesulfonate monooxygenase SsuD/methylene tetrahydromethanopterin reductase-like flavin-dependent oxidoreductase (luciferase family)
MASIELGLFDIQQVDPLSELDHQDVFNQRLDDLELADQLGIAIAFVAERHYLPTYRCQASSVWLGAVSQRTKSMRLGVLAHTLPICPPIRVAEEIALLDQLTNGRIEVGLGLGHRAEELIANGVDPSDRITIFQERLAILEGLWAGGEVTFESAHTQVKGAFIHPRPVQQPHPPLWFAGTQSSAAMWAGQHGMNLAIGFAPDEQLFGATASFRHGLAIRKTRSAPEGDLRRGQIALMRQLYLGPSDASVRKEMVGDLMRLGELDQPATKANRADRKRQADEQYERLIREHIFVAGTPEKVARMIVDTRNKLGASLFLANVYAAGIEQERVRRTMTLLAGPVRDAIDSLTTRL